MILSPSKSSTLFLVLSCVACASGATLERNAALIKDDIAKARAAGALRCAPRELAMAESHVVFMENEIAEGDSVRASRHAELARYNVARALEITDPKECADKQVIIASRPLTIVHKDTDGDGLYDDEDQCPTEAGPAANKGCPIKDTDGDGVLDPDDQCPKEPGPASNKGCPIKDTDGDGLLDPDDMCPNEPGPANNKGCPLKDRDGDGVTDDVDKCPDVPGDPANDGCPKKILVIVKGDHIEIKQQVHFASAKAKILKDSFELLSQVAAAMKSNPAMKVRIEGHTDNVGNPKKNLALSDDRAQSVRKHLIEREGIPADHLEAAGYGQTKPIESNRTARGRTANRRVEFNIISK